MLTTSRASRRRLAAGSAAVSLLIAGGLGLTASSSSAAEALTDRVSEVLQTAPVTPMAPPAPVAPLAAPAEAPKAVTKKRVVIVKDGKTTTYEGADADRYIADHDLPVPPAPPAVAGKPRTTRVMTMRSVRTEKDKDGTTRSWVVDMPDISNADCPGDAAQPIVENSVKDGKQHMVICTNRIERVSRDAERVAVNSAMIERNARVSARANLAIARGAILRDRNLSDGERRAALAGIADAEAELRDAGKD